MTCSIPDCGAPVAKRQWCVMHYTRWHRNGDPLAIKDRSTPLDERLLERIDIGEPNDCWLWTGCVANSGYGVIKAGGRGTKLLLAHRVIFALFVRDLEEGETVDHLCSVRLCLNPDHLEAVSMPENTRRGALHRWHGRTFWPDVEG